MKLLGNEFHSEIVLGLCGKGIHALINCEGQQTGFIVEQGIIEARVSQCDLLTKSTHIIFFKFFLCALAFDFYGKLKHPLSPLCLLS